MTPNEEKKLKHKYWRYVLLNVSGVENKFPSQIWIYNWQFSFQAYLFLNTETDTIEIVNSPMRERLRI